MFTEDSNLIVLLSSIATLILYIFISVVGSLLRTLIDDRSRVPEASTTTETEERRQIRDTIVMDHIVRLMAHQREHQTRLQFNGDSAVITMGRKALRVLPPVKSFVVEDKSSGCSPLECSICMEVFKDGELIQPLGLCPHQFHSSCLYSWLHSGKSTCPLCRVDLATT
ncbi:hypothetical protein HN51_034504 [Arachis hypogaea]|uniref:RING-type E3 ubiquitin transferase n=1 Tax=Arachis hypogaea TaxID=3818 RepID=A0A445A843_ARAHY|nr:RING-H2 finger protein ATL2-like [Arachis ipaensis]XP_025637088.1 RING-H2 finger protein ATL2-like [Arachis hypogaea]QHN99342.1 RING-H2 finger protein [Arachis hypogaea]RYR22621.1 hypothetical protein Ahy_B03g067930 [Arachis hypogaea]